MERIEMVEKLMGKANVSYEEAQQALENTNWDLLDAMIYLERKGKIKTSQESKALVLAKESTNENSEDKKEKKQGGIGAMFGRVCRFIKNIIRKGNKNYFEINKEGEKPIKISLTISALLLIIAFWPVAILLVVGLFLGYKYSLTGPDIKCNTVNDILGKASASAENIKNDFNKEYKSC